MIYFLALFPATGLTIAGYLVLYLASRSEGGLKTFGRYLGFWAFTLAGLIILGAIFAAAHGGRHCPWLMMRGMHDVHGQMYCPWHPGEPGPGDGTRSPVAPPPPGTQATPSEPMPPPR